MKTMPKIIEAGIIFFDVVDVVGFGSDDVDAEISRDIQFLRAHA